MLENSIFIDDGFCWQCCQHSSSIESSILVFCFGWFGFVQFSQNIIRRLFFRGYLICRRNVRVSLGSGSFRKCQSRSWRSFHRKVSIVFKLEIQISNKKGHFLFQHNQKFYYDLLSFYISYFHSCQFFAKDFSGRTIVQIAQEFRFLDVSNCCHCFSKQSVSHGVFLSALPQRFQFRCDNQSFAVCFDFCDFLRRGFSRNVTSDVTVLLRRKVCAFSEQS